MADHKSRNWQRVMCDRADMMSEMLSTMPMRTDRDPTRALADRIRETYIQGYRDGRDSKKTDRR